MPKEPGKKGGGDKTEGKGNNVRVDIVPALTEGRRRKGDGKKERGDAWGR